jgi:lipoprotein-releasing system permease protein
MSIGTAALLIVLSVFNGFESFIKELYTGFYPDIKITAAQGSTFTIDSVLYKHLNKISDIQVYSTCLDEKVLLTNHTTQVIATVKGVDEYYPDVTDFKKFVTYGTYDFNRDADIPPIILGIGLSNQLGATEETHLPISCYVFQQSGKTINPLNAYQTSLFEVTGVYVLQEEIDQQYAIAPYAMISALSGKQGLASSVDVKLKPGASSSSVIKKINAMAGIQKYQVQNRYEQNQTLYFILKSERWAVYAILTLMLIIASFTIVGSMSMLVLDKQTDISMLKAMGMENKTIERIFMRTGVILAVTGAVIGSALAILICGLQQQFGWVKLAGGGDSFLIDAYPVDMVWTDFVLVFTTVICIAWVASFFPARKAARRQISLRGR